MLLELERLRILGDGPNNVVGNAIWHDGRNLDLDLDVGADKSDEMGHDLGRDLVCVT